MHLRLIKNKNKGQSTLEFAVLVVCIVAAAVAMGVYIKRGVQGRIRQSADEIGTLYSPGNTSGGSIRNFSRQTQVKTYTEPGTIIAPGTGESMKGKFSYRREDILSESLEEDTDETVR
jgi:hypothetical protein